MNKKYRFEGTEWISGKEACDLLGMSSPFLKKLHEQGKLTIFHVPGLKLGRYLRAEVLKLREDSFQTVQAST